MLAILTLFINMMERYILNVQNIQLTERSKQHRGLFPLKISYVSLYGIRMRWLIWTAYLENHGVWLFYKGNYQMPISICIWLWRNSFFGEVFPQFCVWKIIFSVYFYTSSLYQTYFKHLLCTFIEKYRLLLSLLKI